MTIPSASVAPTNTNPVESSSRHDLENSSDHKQTVNQNSHDDHEKQPEDNCSALDIPSGDVLNNNNNNNNNNNKDRGTKQKKEKNRERATRP